MYYLCVYELKPRTAPKVLNVAVYTFSLLQKEYDHTYIATGRTPTPFVSNVDEILFNKILNRPKNSSPMKIFAMGSDTSKIWQF